MKIFVFRSAWYGPRGRSFVYSFSPIPADPGRGVAGSGVHPWRELVVPFGSAIAADPATGEQLLRIAGRPGLLNAAEAAAAPEDDWWDSATTRPEWPPSASASTGHSVDSRD